MSVLLGKKAPFFKADAVVNGGEFVEAFSLDQFIGKHVIFFFYPLYFTFVCPADWRQGSVGMKATSNGVAEYLGSH